MNNQHKTLALRVVARALILVVLLPFLPLLSSGQWDWWKAWVYAIISVFTFPDRAWSSSGPYRLI